MNVSPANQAASVAQQSLTANTPRPAPTQATKPEPQRAARPISTGGNRFDAMA